MARPGTRSDRNEGHESGRNALFAAARACPHGLLIEQGGRIVYSNPAFARLLGHEDPQCLIGTRVSKATFRLLRTEDSERKYDLLHFDFYDDRRKSCLHVAHDVTDRRALEMRLRESEKLEAMGRLVGGVAHDFNNILTAIQLHGELMRDEPHDRGARHLDEALLAAQRGSDLVRQLLTFARQHPTATQVVCLRDVVESMRPVLAPLIGEDIELLTRFSTRRHHVHADPAQLQQVVLNLVMNARDAMRSGGQIRVAIGGVQMAGAEAARHGIRPGKYVCLTVDDTGCGMKDEVRARIFEPFFTTKQAGAGTGLGMSTVYGIVGRVGGAVWVASTVGKGTRVSILLPEVRAAAHANRQSMAEMPTRGSETVLVAEDDEAVRSTVAELLEKCGYHVLQARDGLEALRIARSHGAAIDLLLSDVVMPRLNGSGVASRIRRFHPEAKVLFMSGYPDMAAKTVTAHGPLLYKPFSRTVLAQKVRETLEQRPSTSKTARGVTAARGAS